MTMAFLLALTATLGALFIGEVLGQMPCTLCWYQRIAMFPLTAIAGAVGLDVERALADRLHPDTTAILNQDMADLQTMGVRATPTFFLDGRPLTNISFESLSAAIRTAVAQAG